MRSANYLYHRTVHFPTAFRTCRTGILFSPRTEYSTPVRVGFNHTPSTTIPVERLALEETWQTACEHHNNQPPTVPTSLTRFYHGCFRCSSRRRRRRCSSSYQAAYTTTFDASRCKDCRSIKAYGAEPRSCEYIKLNFVQSMVLIDCNCLPLSMRFRVASL